MKLNLIDGTFSKASYLVIAKNKNIVLAVKPHATRITGQDGVAHTDAGARLRVCTADSTDIGEEKLLKTFPKINFVSRDDYRLSGDLDVRVNRHTNDGTCLPDAALRFLKELAARIPDNQFVVSAEELFQFLYDSWSASIDADYFEECGEGTKAGKLKVEVVSSI